MIASMIANVHRKKNQKPFTPEDFMPKGMLEHTAASGSAEQTAQILLRNFEAYQLAQKVTGQ